MIDLLVQIKVGIQSFEPNFRIDAEHVHQASMEMPKWEHHLIASVAPVR